MATQLHALVIDDHEAVREEVREHLATLGHTCAMAGSREEAIRHLAAARFDYVLLDLEIPTRFGRPCLLHTGHALLDEIRGGHPDLPIIVISAKDDDSHRLGMEVLRLNRAADFVRKPFPDPGKGRTLTQTIQEVLAAHGRRHGRAPPPLRPLQPFTAAQMVFYPDRVVLCDLVIAGPERQSHIRCILDQLRVGGPGGHHIRKTGPQLADGSALEATEAAINGAIRDFRAKLVQMLRDERDIDCRPEDVLESGGTGQPGYRFSTRITVVVRTEPWSAAAEATTAAHAAGDAPPTVAMTGVAGRAPADPDPLSDLSPQQREIYAALTAGSGLTNAEIRTRWDISESTVSRRLTPMRERGLIRFHGDPRNGRWVAVPCAHPDRDGGGAGTAQIGRRMSR